MVNCLSHWKCEVWLHKQLFSLEIESRANTLIIQLQQMIQQIQLSLLLW